ncbi:hypothetical protein Ancab_017143, partial [Ancistrocladus abbreviatus]
KLDWKLDYWLMELHWESYNRPYPYSNRAVLRNVPYSTRVVKLDRESDYWLMELRWKSYNKPYPYSN